MWTHLTIIFVAINMVKSSFLPSNLMIEAFDSKVPVYMSLLNLFDSTIFGRNVVDINFGTLVLVVVLNVILGKPH